MEGGMERGWKGEWKGDGKEGRRGHGGGGEAHRSFTDFRELK